MANVPTYQAHAYHHATDLPEEVLNALMRREAPANIILPFAKKAEAFPRTNNDQLWIAVFGSESVEFVLSCTRGPLGKYPIFILACKSAPQLEKEEEGGRDLGDALTPLIHCLLQHVPPQRVFSVFSIARVTARFAEIFVEQAVGHDISIKDTYYDATFTYCTRETLAVTVPPYKRDEDVTISLCRADESHLNELAALCEAFSKTSEPFVLDRERAELEAGLMIDKQQVWIHLIQQGDQVPEIACLVATTRESENVTAVTKVFTKDEWRSRGCAARLLHRVCQDVFQKKSRVVLYVGNSKELASARKVYEKIGFQGLTAGQEAVEGVERWVEIGFTGTDLGYW